MTRGYVIFRKVEGTTNRWEQFTAIVASGPGRAIELATQGDLNRYSHGTFFAVSSSVWARQVTK